MGTGINLVLIFIVVTLVVGVRPAMNRRATQLRRMNPTKKSDLTRLIGFCLIALRFIAGRVVDDPPPQRRPGVRAVHLDTFDTAATALYALDLPIPEEWVGQPVLEIFE